MKKITVLGSCAVDLVVSSPKRPSVGETIIGDYFEMFAGGKGANQAVAAARLGADVTFLGCVGQDDFGDFILDNFKKNNVNTAHVKKINGVSSGVAQIVLSEGDNSIIVIKGANDHVTREYVQENIKVIEEADIVLVQQEIAEDAVLALAEICRESGVPFILNPAPARPLPKEISEVAMLITPNEHEVKAVFPSTDTSEALRNYSGKLLITEGIKGARYHDGIQECIIPAYQVQTVDTTGAGDTFNGALAVALADGKELVSSIDFANRVASISVTELGAQAGMPYLENL